MKKTAAFILIICFSALVLCACAQENVVQSVTEKSIGSVVALTVYKSYHTLFGKAEQSGFSTGFLVLGKYVLTNAHCIMFEGSAKLATEETTDLADKLECRFYNDETIYALSVFHYDLELDLALLTFDKGWPAGRKPLLFGNSDYINYADTAIIIGNAKGYGISVAAGIIGAPEKEFLLPDGSRKIGVQLDAKVKEGNSGSPLLNKKGSVVGVVAFKIDDTNRGEGIGFAIPSNTVYDYIFKNTL